MRITVSCPAALMDDANQLAMCLAFGPADINTYVGLNWQDEGGNLYASSSFEVRTEWIEAAQAPLSRPAWDTDQIINMVAAGRAQAALVFSTEATLASPAAITAIAGPEAPAALAMMGLTPKPEVE